MRWAERIISISSKQFAEKVVVLEVEECSTRPAPSCTRICAAGYDSKFDWYTKVAWMKDWAQFDLMVDWRVFPGDKQQFEGRTTQGHASCWCLVGSFLDGRTSPVWTRCIKFQIDSMDKQFSVKSLGKCNDSKFLFIKINCFARSVV